jgi:hypothetical protein
MFSDKRSVKGGSGAAGSGAWSTSCSAAARGSGVAADRGPARSGCAVASGSASSSRGSRASGRARDGTCSVGAFAAGELAGERAATGCCTAQGPVAEGGVARLAGGSGFSFGASAGCAAAPERATADGRVVKALPHTGQARASVAICAPQFGQAGIDVSLLLDEQGQEAELAVGIAATVEKPAERAWKLRLSHVGVPAADFPFVQQVLRHTRGHRHA